MPDTNEGNQRTRGLIGVAIGALVVIAAVSVYLAWPSLVHRSISREQRKPLTLEERQRAQKLAVAAIVAKGNIEKCTEAHGVVINGIDFEAVCRNNIALRKATGNLDLSACDQLDPKTMDIAGCQTDVVMGLAVRAQDPEVCAPTLPSPLRGLCLQVFWTEQAVSRGDPAICGNIAPPDRIAGCRDNVLLDELVFRHGQVSCSAFSPVLRPGCAAVAQAREHAPPDTELRCADVDDSAFGSLCTLRELMHRLKMSPP